MAYLRQRSLLRILMLTLLLPWGGFVVADIDKETLAIDIYDDVMSHTVAASLPAILEHNAHLRTIRKLRLPKEVAVETLVSPRNIKEIFVSLASTLMTDEEALGIQSLAESGFWKIIVQYMPAYARLQLDRGKGEAKLLKQFEAEIGRYAEGRDESEAILLMRQFQSLMGLFQRVMQEFPLKCVRFFMKEINTYYVTKKFDAGDAKLCRQASELSADIYVFTICEAGLRAGDYQSTLAIAKTYWQGITGFRERDLPKAMEMLRGILADDRDGEAHYYLGVLLKRYARPAESSAESYCLLQRARISGYRQAKAVLKEFQEWDKVDDCTPWLKDAAVAGKR